MVVSIWPLRHCHCDKVFCDIVVATWSLQYDHWDMVAIQLRYTGNTVHCWDRSVDSIRSTETFGPKVFVEERMLAKGLVVRKRLLSCLGNRLLRKPTSWATAWQSTWALLNDRWTDGWPLSPNAVRSKMLPGKRRIFRIRGDTRWRHRIHTLPAVWLNGKRSIQEFQTFWRTDERRNVDLTTKLISVFN